MRQYSETTKRLVGLAGMLLLLCSMGASSAWAADPVKINALLAYPQSYNMKLVRVEGTVSQYRMQQFIGARSKLEKCIQAFSVTDDTGVIDATYATICDMGTVMLRNGDRVTIDAHFSGILDVRSVSKD
ncbi:MAG: conserved exported protein of unknown function [Nitrospira sp.]|nr:MAG: conserved exported protein of unknown function [Nitrospira sp.]